MGMRHSVILLSAICLALASETSGSVKKGDLEIEVLGGLSMESGADQGDDQDSILAGETGTDLDGWFVSAGIGRFFSKNFQIGLVGFGSWLNGSEKPCLAVTSLGGEVLGDVVYDVDVDATVYGAGGRFKWHFTPDKALVPYAGVQVCWATADIDVSGTAQLVIDSVVADANDISESESGSGVLWGPIVGLRYQVAEKWEVFFEYQYRMWSGSIGDFLDDGHAIAAGLCIKLK
jgi:opacity protein-like surface antigen